MSRENNISITLSRDYILGDDTSRRIERRIELSLAGETSFRKHAEFPNDKLHRESVSSLESITARIPPRQSSRMERKQNRPYDNSIIRNAR